MNLLNLLPDALERRRKTWVMITLRNVRPSLLIYLSHTTQNFFAMRRREKVSVEEHVVRETPQGVDQDERLLLLRFW
jgi:hypothetical protein